MWEELSKQLTSYTEKDKELIRTAFEIAERGHKGQQRDSGEPYLTHPIAVATELVRLRLDAQAIAAALLHDVLEDSSVTKAELEHSVGRDVLFLVEALTKLDRVQYQGFERKVESTRKMFLAVAEDVRVVLIKLADRLHNMRTLEALHTEKQKRIAKETLEIYAPLAYRLGIGEFKGELEDLAFPIVYPEEHTWLKEEAKKYLPQRKEYLESIEPVIKKELEKNSIKHFRIDFRTKHLYSLWRKLLRYDMDLGRVTDLVAIRIVVDSIEDCYQTLGIIHALWKPVPSRIKDYIAIPKPNGYRSLHTTVFCEENIVVEFQIRTRQMHEEAEHGIAAHWAYSESGKPKDGIKADASRVAWIKKLQEWQRDIAPEKSEEYMEALKIDFFKDRIFVFTPKGEVIDLPEGATPVDFAYHIHSEVGDHMAGAKVNGKMVPFSYALATGDTVEIIVNKNKKPSPDWLSFARSSLSRGQIRSALRKQGIEITTPKAVRSRAREVTFLITRENRVGLLKDITTLLSKEKIDITKTESDLHDTTKPHLTVRCKIPRACDFDKLLVRLRRIKGVKSVEVAA